MCSLGVLFMYSKRVAFHVFLSSFTESTASVGSPEVSPKAEGELVTSPECHDQHADPFDPEKPRKVRPVRTTPPDVRWRVRSLVCVRGCGSLWRSVTERLKEKIIFNDVLMR